LHWNRLNQISIIRRVEGCIVLGYGLVLLAGLCFTFQNVIVRVLFTQVDLFGTLPTGGFVEANLPNSFLLLFMRTGVGVPLMACLLPTLYPKTWSDIRHLSHPSQRPQLKLALVGGVLMFLYLALLYVAIGQIPAGIALTLFFTFPVFTALFSWFWFGTPPSRFQWGIMALIFLGSWLTLPQPDSATANSWLGVTFGLASGVTYALYTVIAQKSFEHFHPIPFTWMSFALTLVLSALSLLVWHGQMQSLPWTALWIGGLLSAISTFAGHMLNNLGIRLVGATAAALLGAANPALTALFAWVALQEKLSALQSLGIGLVVISIAALSARKPTPH
jgi:drug/metabolite transporter (DMT)-like permease